MSTPKTREPDAALPLTTFKGLLRQERANGTCFWENILMIDRRERKRAGSALVQNSDIKKEFDIVPYRGTIVFNVCIFQ
jgi:pectin methylesterase-like acyl-CoA thioesterase